MIEPETPADNGGVSSDAPPADDTQPVVEEQPAPDAEIPAPTEDTGDGLGATTEPQPEDPPAESPASPDPAPEAPVDQPAEAPIETPAETPIETPVEP